MNIPLFRAVKVKYDSSTGTYLPAANGLWFYHAKPKTAMPYVTMTFVDGVATYVMGGAKKPQEDLRVQLSIWSDNSPGDATEILNLYNDLVITFDGATLNTSGYDDLKCTRIGEQLFFVDANQCWHYPVDYKIWIDKQ